MLTIVSVPLPFSGNQLTIDHQHNAIKSWTLLEPRPEIILLGNEYGIAEVAEQYNVHHVPEIGRNELGDLSMRSIFRQADKYASNDWISYTDTDVILLDDFMPMFFYLVTTFCEFVSCAGRWDANIPGRLDFDNPDWQKAATDSIFKLHPRGADYCIYRTGFYHEMPDFSIGRGWWDGWRMGYPFKVGVPLVNVERVCKAIHQKHGHRWSGQPGTGRNKGMLKGTEAWVTNASNYVEPKDMQCF